MSEGSPPHTRGKGGKFQCHAFTIGITPAHAGKRPLVQAILPPLGDHPRTRGEKIGAGLEIPADLGSPPHTRGKEQALVVGADTVGITPAHAGKSLFEQFLLCPLRDHPRTRGEKATPIAGTPLAEGSPPHTRGKD